MRLLVSLVLAASLALASTALRAQDGPPMSREQVQEAVAQLKQDPNLAGKRRQKTLRAKDSLKDKEPPPDPSTHLRWLIDFLSWVADASRLLVWVLGAGALAVLLVGLRHWIRWRGGSLTAAMRPLPSHVRDLDIRQESLPADIGAVARALWEQDRPRDALSLLYRGALSRLVHRHAVPIRASSTEEECVHLAALALDRPRSDFLARLVNAWQLTVYGSRSPERADVLALCAGFDAQMGTHDPEPRPPALARAVR